MLIFALFVAKIYCEGEVLYGTFTKANGNFIDNNYLNKHKISLNDFRYSSSESFINQPISNAFAGANENVYWVSNDEINETSKTYIMINFTDTTFLEGFTIDLAYRSRGNNRFFDGAPLELNVYTSLDEGPFILKHFFNGTYNTAISADWRKVQFVFTNPLECDTLKIEFAKVTLDESFSHQNSSVVKNLVLISYINESINVDIASTEGNYADESYVNEHKIPSSYFTYRTSGEKPDYPATNLFDDLATTYWVSKDPNQDSFKNYIIIDFKNSVSLEGFLYDTAYRTKGQNRNFDGFPTKLKVFTSLNDEGFKLAYQFNGNPVWPWTRVQFIFPDFVNCDKIKLEFTSVTDDVAFGGGYTACSAGLIFLQHISDEYQKTIDEINSIFTDYVQLTLNESYTSEKIEQLRQKAMQYASYESELKPIFERVEAIHAGTIKKDPHREFSTKPGSRNMLEQYGDTAGYCRNKILFTNFGTNRQVIGIGGNTGKPIVVFVDVEPEEGQSKSSVRLPTITFTQIFGSWQSSFRTSNLKLGRNNFIFPDIQTQGYSVSVEKGGPIHISNPYTYETQRGHVTIYIEGGYVYPVFHRGDDEESFKIILSNYYKRLNDPEDTDITIDTFEAVSDHVMTSCSCTLAYITYVEDGLSAQKNIDNWDAFLGELLAFGGLPFEKDNPKYNPMNDHVRQNFRTVQPYAGFFAFACTEMIGLPDSGTHKHCVQLGIPGWAFAHEFGHTVDKKGRVWGENTNNMWAMYNIFFMNGEIYERIPIAEVSTKLAPDFSDYVTHKNGTYLMTNNPTVWWILEGAKPGYWADSENSFIYEESDRDENGNSIIGMTERLVYYATLSFGQNMSTYFERWGFCMDKDKIFNTKNRWNYQNATDNFKNLMVQAKEQGRFTEEIKKYWYINLGQYEYLYANGNKLTEKAHCYNLNEYITPLSIAKNGDNYVISLPAFKCPEAHLCYEIQSFINNEWKVVGVTYTQLFADSYDYNGAEIKYRIYAYDRCLDHTGDPPNDFTPSENEEKTCKINETLYDTLQDAVNAAENGDTIVLLRSFMLQNIDINKKVKIIPDEGLEGPITITKISPGNLININNLGTSQPNIQIGDNSRVKIILDGGGFKQLGRLIHLRITKKLYLYNVELRNNVNTDNGGAIYIDYNSHMEMTNCIVEKCSSSKSGGAVYLCGGSRGYYHCELIINNVIFRDNSAAQDGGAIDASGYMGYSRLASSSDVIFENNVAGRFGGAIYAVRYEQFAGTIFRGNQAKNGGAICADCSGHEFELCASNFTNNKATENGSDIYLKNGILKMNGGKFDGTIHKVTGTTIRFNQFITSYPHTVPDFTECTFTIDLLDGGNNLIDSIGDNFVPLIPDALDTFKVQNGFVKFENNIITAYPSQSTLTITFNQQTFSLTIPYGDFILPSTFEGFSDDYSISAWIKDGVTYNVGDKLFIDRDCSFTINALKYCNVKLIYREKEQIVKIVPNTKYYLPMTTPDDETVFGWECSDGNYYVYADPVLITSDLTFTAVLMKKVSVTIIIGDDSEVYKLNYNEIFTIPTPPNSLNGLTFKYFYEGDYKYQPGDQINILNDITITAYYSNKISISYVSGENEETLEYQQNEVISLPVAHPENPNKPNSGREFISWSIENVNYYPFYKYSVVKNIKAVANYRLIDKSAPITITYELPNVLSEYPHFVDGTTTKTESHSYLENLTLPDEDYFSSQPNGLGYDRNTSRENLFDYWLINGKRYNGSESFGITEAFTAILVTKLSTKGLPSETPTQTPSETPTASNLPSSTPLPSNTPTPDPTQIKTDPDISDINKDNNLYTINLDCKIMNGNIKINLKCSTCLISEYMWFTIFFEDGQIDYDKIQYDDRDVFQVNNNLVKLDFFVNKTKIQYNSNTEQLMFDTGSQNILLMDGQAENNLKCYPPPTSSPAPTETPTKSPIPVATPIQDYSNKEFTGLMQTIYCDESFKQNKIENSKFTDISLENDDNEYLIVVQKEMHFNNIQFIFQNTHIGAIKIDFEGEVTITNCVFTGCSVNNGNGNAILIVKNSEGAGKIIENCAFNSCGTKGYSIYSNEAIVMRNNNVTFEGTNSACGGLMIRKCGTTITNCNFINNRAKGAIMYNPIGTTAGFPFIIEQCNIENCEGIGLYCQIATLSPDEITIRQSSFKGCFDPEMSNGNAISFNEVADSFSLDVNDCTFRNCGTSGFLFKLSAMRVKEDYLDSLISFSNTVFEFETGKSGSGIEIEQIDRKVVVHNCTFKQMSPNVETDDLVTTIYAPSLGDIVIEQSKFIDCGGGVVISVENQEAEISLQNCTFDSSSQGSSCGSPLYVRKESIYLVGNTFSNCNAIQIQTKILDTIQFKLIDNHFTKCIGSLINVIDGFQTIPIIQGNVFENIHVDTELFSFTITVDSSSIEFDNNTFSDVTTKFGGFGGRIQYPTSESEDPIQLTFSKCFFLDNIQNTQGGAFRCCEIQNNHNAKLSFIDCNFENNKAKAFGGALYINYDLDTTIINCVFNSNLGGDGQGAAIFIAAKDMSVSITECNFKDNADFEDDKIDGFAIRSQASSLDISGCTIEYTDITSSISGLQIESTSNSASINNCHFIKCSGAERTSFVIECQNAIIFTNNYIDSCSYDENLGKIFIFGDATEQAIISCNFTNNVMTKSSPNSGLLIQKQQTQGNFNVRYESCKFMSNTASIGSGGALFLKTEDVNDLEKTISVTMAQCIFENNNADINGGALCVSCATSISITNSDFINNVCNNRGGAIYIDYSISESSSSQLNDNAYCTISSCKFERNKASEYGNAIFVHELRQNSVYEIQNNNFIDNYCEESNEGYVIAASYYNINVDQNTFNNQNTNIPVNKFFLLSLVPSKSPSQSPSQTPKPTMTVIPGTNDNYINKEYKNTIPPCSNTENQIQVESGKDINQISGCRFININHDKNYFIRIKKDIPFFDNYFEYNDEYSGTKQAPAPIWADQLPAFTMTRCTFINSVTRKADDANVFSCTNYNTYITIESCNFINCGNSADQFIIRLPLDKSAIKIMRSKFEFTDLSKSCKVTNTINNAHYLVINGSSFIGCAPDTFEFSICSDSNFVPTEPFQFNDNIVKNAKGQFMKGNNLRNKPIINGNTFQDVELNGKFLISLSHNRPDIEISRATFSNIKTGGNDYGGGIAILLPTTLTDSSHITVAFTKCQFINNEVYQASSSVTDDHYNGDGGAIHYGYEISIVETDIKFIDCTFNQNKAYRHGGAISLQIAGSVLIQNCIFEENVANNKGVSSGELLYENHYNKKNSGVGGAIYINPTFNANGKDYHMTNITIDGCSFIKNKAFNGYAIYIEGENLDIPFVISDNDFINNYNENNSPTKGGVIASELMNLNKDDIEKLNEFINNELGTEAEKIVFVNHNGWPIDEDTPEPETPIATPEETPTQTPLGYEELLQKQAIDDYAQNAIYANQHKIPNELFTYEHSGAKNDRPITNAFDDNKGTYWVTSNNNTDTFKNYLTITFSNTQHIEAILFDSAYSTRKNDNPITRRYDGYPQIFKIYISMKDEELKLHSIFSGAPKETDIWDRTKLEFSTPIICDRIKVEFDEVTLDESFGNDYSVAVGNILFISPFSFVQTPEPTPIATPEETPTQTPLGYEELLQKQAIDDYAQNAIYANQHKIPNELFTYEHSGAKNDRPITNAFDDNKGTYWVTSNNNTDTFKNYLTITFSNTQHIEAILFDSAYSTRKNDNPVTRRYDGYPQIFKIYTSMKDEELKLHSIFSGAPKETDIWDRTKLEFSTPIICDRIKVEFDEVTLDESFGNDYSVAVGNILFISPFSFVQTPEPTPIATPEETPTQTPLGYEELLQKQAIDDYAQNAIYANQHKIPNELFTYEHSGAKNDRPITNAFDDNKGTYWVTSNNNTDTFKNYLTITFSNTQHIEAILFDSAYSTRKNDNPVTRRYDGYPQIFKIYISMKDEELKLHSIFSGAPKETDIWDRTKLEFSTPIICDRIKVEFDEVTLDESFGNDYSVAVGNILFISPFSFVQTPEPTPIATPEETPTQTPLGYEELLQKQAIDDYAQNAIYANQHKIPNELFTYEHSGAKNDRPITNAFDNNKDTFWVTLMNNTDTFKNYLTITFSNTQHIEAILFDSAYSTRKNDNPVTRRYDGYPQIFKIYTSMKDEELKLHSIFSGAPKETDIWDRTKLEFSTPIICDRIKVEFDEVTLDESFGNDYSVAVGNILFISPFSFVQTPEPTPIATPEETPTQTPLGYEELLQKQAIDDYAQNAIYANQHKIPNELFTYEHSGAKNDRPITNAFDNNKDTFWVTLMNNTDTFKNYLTITFSNTQHIEAILFDSAYSTRKNDNPVTRRYDGYPQIFKIYTSMKDEELKLHSIFSGAPKETDIWDRTKLEFSTPIICDRIKVEFDEVTLDESFGNDYSVAVGNILFISPFSFVQTPEPTPIATPEETPTQTPLGYEELLQKQAIDDYAQNAIYANQHKIPNELFTYEHSGAKNDRPITNAFDDNKGTYWVTSNNNTDTFKNYLTITFSNTQHIEAILFDSAYSTRKNDNPVTRRYDGYPQIFKIYISMKDEELKLHSIFSGAPKETDIWDRTKLEFSTPIICDRIKVEFDEVTLDESFGNDYSVAVGNILFISPFSFVQTPEPTPIATPEETPTQTPLGYEELLQKQAIDDYAQNAIYANQHKIPNELFTYEHSGAKNDRPITNAFDNNKDTFWVTLMNNTDTFKNYLTITFSNTQHIEAILFDSAYSTRKNDNPVTRRYDGYPQIFKIYTSMKDEELKLHSIFSGAPKETDIWDRTKLEFSTPIICDRIKVEFDEVTLDESFGNDYSVAVGNILFISPFSFVQTPEPTPIATPEETPTQTPLGYEELLQKQAIDDYAQNAIYANQHKIPNELFTYEHSGAKNDRPITNAFDDNKGTYWVTSNNNTDTFKNYLTITFSNTQHIEAILFDSAYSTRKNDNPVTRRYDGYPQIFKIYTSMKDEELKLHSIFSGAPKETDIWDRTKLEFSTPIICDRIKVEFDEVTLDESFGNDYSVAVGNILFISPFSFVQTPEPTPIATPEETPTQTPLGYEELLQKQAIDDYAQNAIYANQHKIPNELFTYEHSGAKNDRPITNAFDDNKGTYWVTSNNNTDTFKNYLTITFSNTQHIEAILFDSAYSTRKNDNPVTRRYDGYPQIFKIYISMKDEELKLHSIFSGAPKETDIWDRTKLEFSTPIICDRIKVEFDEVTLDESFGNDYSVAVGNILFISPFSFVQTPEPTPIATPAATSTPTPTPLPTATMTPTPAETTPTEIIVEHDNLNNDLRYNKTVDNFDAITVNIKVTNFTGINHTDNGGAIYVVNAGFKCRTTKFVDCSSTEAGGGIHLSYFYDYENSYELDSLIFIHCTAQYGGAVYLYSSSWRNSVQISGCQFMNNIALRTKGKDSKFGGSAIFMTARTGEIKSNTMVDNSGDSAVKIYNHFSRSTSSMNKLMDLEHDTVIISECKFENSKKSLGFIYYFLGNGASKFELRNCYFYGELKEGAHYIDGKALSKNGPKLTIKKCRFAIDSRRAHNLDPSVISVDLDDQYFNYSDDHKSFNWWKVIVTIAVPAVVIAIIIFVIIFVNNHKNNNIIEEYEMAERSFIISENDNELNFPSV